jgi:hypothetical protein
MAQWVLALTISGAVVVVVAIVGTIGYLIDKRAERLDMNQDS